MMYMVLFFVMLPAILAEPLTEEQKAKMMEFSQQCVYETGVDHALVDKARIGEFVDDEKFKQHLFCFSKKMGFQDDAGKIQVDVVESKLKDEIDGSKLEKLMSTCAIEKDTPENTAYESLKCFYKIMNGS